MISIVNRTVWTTTDESSPQTTIIPATTAGNTLLIMSMTPGVREASPPEFNGSRLGNPSGRFGSGFYYVVDIPASQTTLIWNELDGIVPSAVVVYELSPCTFAEDGSLDITHSNSETGYTLNQSVNSAYFEVIAQNATSGVYNSVSSPWDFDYAISPLPQTGSGMGSVVYILNTTGSAAPIWSLVNGGTECGCCAVAFNDNSGPPTTTFSFQDPSGNPLAGGTVTFQLTYDISTATSGGTQIAAGKIVTATLDSSGSISIPLVANAGLLPAGSSYRVVAYTVQGQPAWRGLVTVSY